MKEWSLKKEKRPEWPLGENGEKVPPAFLEHITGSRLDMEMELGLLSAYGIPTVTGYSNDGEFSELILGFAATGVDIYVPETMLEDARNIISCDLSDIDFEEEE